jgi:superfamily II DNA or RNA helicase
MITLYDYQQQAFDETISQIQKNPDDAKGRLLLPTGAGKSVLMATILQWQFDNNTKHNIHLVLAPRIMLGNQLLSETRKMLGPTAFRAIAFHSGEHAAEDGVKWKEEATTQIPKVQEAYDNAQKLGQPLVVFCTYHSAYKLADHFTFDTICGDEAQYLVSENFGGTWRAINARVGITFTATERHTASESGLGLNNETVFGPRWYYISSQELIDKGRIVPPRLHVAHIETQDDGLSILSQVIEIAKKQIELTNNTLAFSKILFAMSGTGDVQVIEDNLSTLRSEFPNHDVFTITSKSGALINGKSVKRKKFLEILKDCENALIFHYDILSEGIDVDGITGVGIMRNMSLSKLLQTIGRAIRLYKPDPSLKPQAWISVPVVNGNEDDMARIAFILRTLRNGGYDLTKEDVYETKQDRHEADDENMSDLFDNSTKGSKLLDIEQIIHQIEEDKFWTTVQEESDVNKKLDMFF